MSILTGSEIIKQVEAGRITIDPFDPSKVGPNSYDLHLGNTINTYVGCDFSSRYYKALLDVKKDNQLIETEINSYGLVLEPGELFLAHTIERTHTDHYIPMFEGISSIGRLGLFVHVTAGFGDIGFNGQWTLEMSCVQPIRIYPGIRIGQIYFHEPVGEIKYLYKGKYQNSKSVIASKSYQDWEE